jgi:hypothetical protein
LLRLIALLLEPGAAGIEWSEIGVMAPYVGQIDLLRARLRTRRIPFEGTSGDLAWSAGEAPGRAGGLSIGTVHRFQGGERSVVLFSTVVTERRSVPFLDDRVNLLNVAVSRARSPGDVRLAGRAASRGPHPAPGRASGGQVTAPGRGEAHPPGACSRSVVHLAAFTPRTVSQRPMRASPASPGR